MSRLPELREARPGLFGRIIYFFTRRELGRVPEPVKVAHRNKALLAGVVAYELGLQKSTRVPHRLKCLAEVRAALEIGCAF
jgi:hypothetical protein